LEISTGGQIFADERLGVVPHPERKKEIIASEVLGGQKDSH
jgi:hypothetical protein